MRSMLNNPTIECLEELESIISKNLGVLIYFSSPVCNVGEVFEPKVRRLLEEEYPKIPFYHVDMNQTPAISAKYSVFVMPTIIIFFDGKETIKKSRHIGIAELADAIRRPYSLIFD